MYNFIKSSGKCFQKYICHMALGCFDMYYLEAAWRTSIAVNEPGKPCNVQTILMLIKARTHAHLQHNLDYTDYTYHPS